MILLQVIQRFLNILVGMESHRHKLHVTGVEGSDNAVGRCERRQIMPNGCALAIVDGNALDLAG